MKVLVCGSYYGQTYLRALVTSGFPFQIAGILANGSERSHRVALKYKTRLFNKVSEIPHDVVMSCVAIGGEAGTEITLELFRKLKGAYLSYFQSVIF